MTRIELLAELNAVLDDNSTLPHVSDGIKYKYLAEGQEKFCEDTGFFTDNTTFTVATVAGTSSYALDSRIIQVLEVWHGTKKLTMMRELDYPVDLGNQTQYQPTYWHCDQETGHIKLYPTPDAVYTLTLRSWRYPLTSLSTADTSAEIPSRLQRACVEWAAFKCLNHHDSELIDKVKASEHFNLYQLYVSDGKTAHRRIRGVNPAMSCNPLYLFR